MSMKANSHFEDYISPARNAGADRIRFIVAKAEGRKPSLPLPGWITGIHDALHKNALEIARSAYEQSGRFFHVPSGISDSISSRRWDEVETSRVFRTLLTRIPLEELPGYSVENHREAIDYWQSWQNTDAGTFHNPRYVNPQAPDEVRESDPVYLEHGTNAKYIPIVLALLGAEPMYQPQLHGSIGGGGVDYDELWRTIIEQPYYNHGGAIVNGMLRRIANGYQEYVPATEYAISHTVGLIDETSGVFPRENQDWSNYGAIEPTLKAYTRLIGQQAVEHMPDKKIRAFADWLIENRDQFAAGSMEGNMRNATELFIQALQYHDYRRDELIVGLEKQMADLAARPQIWETDYSRYNTVLLASFLCGSKELAQQLVTPYQGGWFAHRPVMGPYSAWVNLIPKTSDEFAENPEWNYEIHGLKARNDRHRRKVVTEIVPVLADTHASWRYVTAEPSDQWTAKNYDDKAWTVGIPPIGKTGLWLRKTIDKKIGADLNPWLTAEWSGEYEVFLDGVPVKRVIKSFRKCGWYVPPEARKALQSGPGVLAIRSRTTTPDGFLKLGIVDWR
jgi:hypothetical protein